MIDDRVFGDLDSFRAQFTQPNRETLPNQPCEGNTGPAQRIKIARAYEAALGGEIQNGLMFPLPSETTIQALDSSARNPLICNGRGRGLCGLQAYFGERGRSEEWPGESEMCPEAAKVADRWSPQVSAKVRANTRHL